VSTPEYPHLPGVGSAGTPVVWSPGWSTRATTMVPSWEVARRPDPRRGWLMLAVFAFALNTGEVLYDIALHSYLPALVPETMLQWANSRLITAETIVFEFAGPAAGGVDDEDREQSADVVAGQRDQPVGSGAVGVLGDGDDHEQGVGEHGEQGPALPGDPAADLVFVEPGQTLTGLEGLLDRPSPARDPDQLAQRHHLGGVAAVERQFTGVSVAAHE